MEALNTYLFWRAGFVVLLTFLQLHWAVTGIYSCLLLTVLGTTTAIFQTTSSLPVGLRSITQRICQTTHPCRSSVKRSPGLKKKKRERTSWQEDCFAPRFFPYPSHFVSTFSCTIHSIHRLTSHLIFLDKKVEQEGRALICIWRLPVYKEHSYFLIANRNKPHQNHKSLCDQQKYYIWECEDYTPTTSYLSKPHCCNAPLYSYKQHPQYFQLFVSLWPHMLAPCVHSHPYTSSQTHLSCL